MSKSGKYERSKHIAQQLNESDYDVIIFQEAFDNNVRKKLSVALREHFPFQEGPANANGGIKTNSGVWIVSKLPLKKIGEIQFGNSSGTDWFSRKGALMVEVEKNGQTVQVVGTHLQASDGKNKQKIREKQYRQIQKELLSVYNRKGIAQVICGDFNTRKSEKKNYEIMLQVLQANDGELSGDRQFSYDGSDNDMISDKKEISLLDYILLRNNDVRFSSVIRSIKSFVAKWHETKRHLSDHFAMEIILIPETHVQIF